MPYVVYPDGSRFENPKNGIGFLREAALQNNFELKGAEIHDVVIDGRGLYHDFVDTKFVHCTFIDCNMMMCTFKNVTMEDCNISGETEWWLKKGLKFFKNGKETKMITTPIPNEHIKEVTGGKVQSLPNKEFVKITCTCDFCHKEFSQIMRRRSARPWMKTVPNSTKRVCDDCYKSYRLEEKILGHRHYGYAGSLSFYRTPMDKGNTAILGLEMEFEGDFYGWKELQDAHKGQLHYGYDSSVRGQNELSWDCGSYSWWKYLSHLKAVCEALEKNGGSAGDTAGIHIHVSRPDVNVLDVTDRLNRMCKSGAFKTLMKAVSLRNDVTRFEHYANLDEDCNEHHAAISYNNHGTCEFRVFNSSLDYKLILQHLLFCKTIFNAVADNVPQEQILPGLAKGLKAYIIKCADIQKDKGFITPTAYNNLMKTMIK